MFPIETMKKSQQSASDHSSDNLGPGSPGGGLFESKTEPSSAE